MQVGWDAWCKLMPGQFMAHSHPSIYAWNVRHFVSSGACLHLPHGSISCSLAHSTFATGFSFLQASGIMLSLLSDIAYFDGRLPPSWDWPPVTAGEPPPTLVIAQNTTTGWPWPGGGVRVERNWRQSQCNVLAASGLSGQEYWWCD